MNEQKSSVSLADVLDARIASAAIRQHAARGSTPHNKPKNWEEIEAYAEWIASIRVREELLSIKREVA